MEYDYKYNFLDNFHIYMKIRQMLLNFPENKITDETELNTLKENFRNTYFKNYLIEINSLVPQLAIDITDDYQFTNVEIEKIDNLFDTIYNLFLDDSGKSFNKLLGTIRIFITSWND